MPLTLEAQDLQIIKWWVDASYAPHADMRSHTGASMTIGKGAPITVSSKQKINTKSSTEAEVVAVDDVMGHVMWTRYFMSAQGIEIKDNIVYQDNEAAMLLESNGRRSSTKRTKHMNVRFFFVKDRIGSGEISLIHCPTLEMVGDYFTKPSLGKQFYKFRKLVMNLEFEKGDFASKPV